jgi:hypothetical protein
VLKRDFDPVKVLKHLLGKLTDNQRTLSPSGIPDLEVA